MKQHFVKFYSPGTFVSEESTKPVDAWCVDLAVRMAREITERHGATPYGFRFITRERGPDDLDSHVSDKSPMYYLGGTIETLEQVKARATEADNILISNMEGNKIGRIITNNNSWKWTAPLYDDDIVLEFTP